MRLVDPHRDLDPHSPTVDEVEFRSLYRKSTYRVRTADRWSLSVTRYRPIKQPFAQPLFDEPLLLVHGFSQNRHAWTSGQFVKNLLFFGLDIHIVELRGHGKSSIELQRERSRRLGTPLPADLDYGWDIDSYFLYDVPAAIAGVKRITRRSRIFYCGHSMGGMLGYGYAGIHPEDIEGLITIGSAADLGRGFPLLRAMAFLAPLGGAALDLMFASYNASRRAQHLAQRLLPGGREPPLLPTGSGDAASVAASFRYIPVNAWYQFFDQQIGRAEKHPGLIDALRRWNRLSNPTRVRAEDVRFFLRNGGEREPRKVLEQFARWIRRGELTCYRTGYDFKRGFEKIDFPMAIIFGDLDPLASVASTRSVYRAARSQYLLWRPVKGNSHLELTMGHDIRQICYDIKNLIEYARSHRHRKPTLPRLEA